MTEDKTGRGTISTLAEPHKSLFEVIYQIHIEENDEPPVRPGVEVRAIKWVDIKAAGPQTKALRKGDYVLTEQGGSQHHIQFDNGGWSYMEPIKA